MKIIQYIQWTEPGERAKFNLLVQSTNNDLDLCDALVKEFGIQRYEANTVVLRFAKEIKELRKK